MKLGDILPKWDRRMPRAAFGVEARALADADSKFPQMLSQHLASRFKATPAERPFSLSIWGVDVEAGKKTITIGLKKSNLGPGLWILMVSPGGMRGVLALLLGRRSMDMSVDLLPVCHEIHAFLTENPGISDVRWYLTGSGTAVATPEELPWGKA